VKQGIRVARAKKITDAEAQELKQMKEEAELSVLVNSQ
jgi:hypothetical protein